MNSRRMIRICVAFSGCVLLFYVSTRAYYKHHASSQDVRKKPALVTLFTSWRAFPERYEVYNNTLRNWASLHRHVNTILFTNDNIPDEYKQLGWTVLPVPRQIKGFPVLKHLFLEAMQRQPYSKLYAFSNGDLLFTDSFIASLLEITNSPLLVNKTFLIVGRRMNTPNITREDASSWENIGKAAKRGKLMNENYGIDYFITTPDYHWKYIPEVQIGQNFYDNWLVWDARRMGHEVIDATDTLLAVHQNAPYPKQQGSVWARNHNLAYFNVTRGTLGSKGTIPCCGLHTVYINHTTKLQRRKQKPRHCSL